MSVQHWERALDRLDDAATAIYDLLLFLLARVALVAVTLAEVRRNSRLAAAAPTIPSRIRPAQARFHFDQIQESSKHTDEKVKQLLTLSVALNAFLVAFARALGGGALVFTVALGLTACVFLCVGTLRVRSSALPDLQDALSDPGEHGWARDLVAAAQHQRLSHLYRVDLYRAARRWFVLALTLALAIVAAAPRDASPPPVKVEITHVIGDTAGRGRQEDEGAIDERGPAAAGRVEAVRDLVRSDSPAVLPRTGQPAAKPEDDTTRADRGSAPRSGAPATADRPQPGAGTTRGSVPPPPG